MGAGMGTIMPASMQTATLGVDRQYAGVAGALVNTSQQVGGSIGTALLNTLVATAVTDYLVAHAPVTAAVGAEGLIHGYDTAYWTCAAIFVGGAVLAALVFRRRNQGLALHTGHQEAPAAQAQQVAEPVDA
jgi:MFS family permease